MSGKMKTVAVLTNENAILRGKLADMERERDEAREWARCMKRERDEALRWCDDERGVAENFEHMIEQLTRERDEARKWERPLSLVELAYFADCGHLVEKVVCGADFDKRKRGAND